MALVIPGHTNPGPQEVSLSEISEVLGDCKLCPLWETRNNIVFGQGNPGARVLIIGEAPGKQEDLQGKPFVGASGKKFDALLDKAGLDRDLVYITNVLKCRPPSNRDPRVGEMQTCAPYLREQIRSIWPDVIVCLGNFSARFVLHTELGMTNLRGHFYKVGHFTVMPTFHPAAACYRKQWQELMEEDFKMLGEWLRQNPSKKEL